MTEEAVKKHDVGSPNAQEKLDALVATLGGPEQLLGLLTDYRQVTAALATARDANSVLPQMRCWWSRHQKARMAADLPVEAQAPFLK